MKLTKKEAGMIRQVAFFKNVLDQNVEDKLRNVLARIPEKKHPIALAYFEYLTTNEGVKTYVVDFVCNGAGHLTYHDCTAEEAKNKAIHALQNGAFGNFAKLEDIIITKVSPETISYNTFEDFLRFSQQVKTA
jgi:hypothetical protein